MMLLGASVIASSSWLTLSSSTAAPGSVRQTSRTKARARASSVRSLEISSSARASGGSRSSIFTATQVRSSPNVSEFENATAAWRISIDQRLGLEPAVGPNTLGKPLYAKQLAGAVPRFRQPVGIEEQDVSRIQRDADLVVDLPLADPQRQVLSLQHGARPGARLEMDRRGVAAVDEIDRSVLEIEPGVADGHETLELDQLPCDLRVRQRHDVLRLRERSWCGERNQAAERLQKVALGCGAEQRRGNPLAHHVSDDDVEAVVPVLEEIVEVAVDALRRNGERGHAHARHVSGRLVEQERLLDLEADLDLLLTRPRQLLLRALALGDVFGDADQIFRLPVGAEDRDLDGVQVAQTSMGVWMASSGISTI